jgi:hypothetical protein
MDSKQPLTYSEKTSTGKIEYYGIAYTRSGHSYYLPATSRSDARRKALAAQGKY